MVKAVAALLVLGAAAARATVVFEEAFTDGARRAASRGPVASRAAAPRRARAPARRPRPALARARVPRTPRPRRPRPRHSGGVHSPSSSRSPVAGWRFRRLPPLTPPPPSRQGAAWEKRWVKSSWKRSDGTAGDFALTAGKWFGEAEADTGIQTGPDARFFAIAAPFAAPFDSTGKTLVVQASPPRRRGGVGAASQPPRALSRGAVSDARHPPHPRSTRSSTSRSWTAAAATSSCCPSPRAHAAARLAVGGPPFAHPPSRARLPLAAPPRSKLEDFSGDTPYSVMFGPDICGYSTKKVHVILTCVARRRGGRTRRGVRRAAPRTPRPASLSLSLTHAASAFRIPNAQQGWEEPADEEGHSV